MEAGGGNAESIDEYIAQFPPDVQERLEKLRRIIREEAPGAVERISYRMPTFVWHGNLVHFAGYRHHIGFYPTASGISAFQARLSDYEWAKGSVRFPLDQPVPYDLVRAIVAFRVAENTEKAGRAGHHGRREDNA